MNRVRTLLCMGLASLSANAGADGYVGTYTAIAGSATGSAGIYHFRWDVHAGRLSGTAPTVAAVDPSFLVMHPNGKVLYAADESTARISAYAALPDGRLTPLNAVPAEGKGPCHLAIDPSGRWLFVANYGTGNIITLPVAADGTLGEARQRIQHHDDAGRAPHAHQTVISPDGRFVMSVDLGLDKVFIYRFDRTTGELTPNTFGHLQAPLGSGPRHLVFSQDNRRLYVLTEKSAELLTLAWDAAGGSLRQEATVCVLPPDYASERSGAEIALHPNGRWLYVSSRGTANDIAVFELDDRGVPHLVTHQSAGVVTPRFIGIAPEGRYLLAAGQSSNDISIFRIKPSGRLEAHGRTSLPAPVDILWR